MQQAEKEPVDLTAPPSKVVSVVEAVQWCNMTVEKGWGEKLITWINIVKS